MSFDLLDGIERDLAASTVGIVEFAESDEYCARPLFPRQRVLLKTFFLEDLEGWEEDILDGFIKDPEIKMSPNIRERREFLRGEGYKHFREINLVGGRRSSKGFMTGLALAKVMWDTLQLQDPGAHYGIDPTKEIYFACIAGSEAQAKEYQFADLTNTVETCKAFEPYIVNALETELRVATPADLARVTRDKAGNRKGKGNKDIARLRGKAWAANAGTLRGSATMALCIDEMAHMLSGQTKASADEVYKAAIPATGQFGIDAMIFCNSSPYSKVGMFYERYQEAMREYNPEFDPGESIGEGENDVNGNPLIMGFQYPSWALYQDHKNYRSKWQPQHRYKTLEVSSDWDPKDPRWNAEERSKIRQMKAEEAANPETFKVERRAQFAEVVDAYLNSNMVDRIFQGKPIGYDDGKVLLQPYSTNINTAINLNQYKFHLDPSSTTAGFGFAIAHEEKIKDPNDVEVSHVVFDMVKRWNPKDFPGETIDWEPIIDEVLLYADIYRPFEITFDQFQSEAPIQSLHYKLIEKGIGGVHVGKRQPTNTEQWHQWENFKTAINHGLVHAPIDCLAIDPYGPDEELKFLQKKATSGNSPRVEKQDIGPVQTKDMADCMADCVESLIGNVLAEQIRQRAVQATMALGAQGGYPIGGNDNERPSLRSMLPHFYGQRMGEQSAPDGAGSMNRRALPRGAIGGGSRRGMSRGKGRSRGRW